MTRRLTMTSTVRSPAQPKTRRVAKGFSVKDILDLPSSKASSSSPPSASSLPNSRPDPALDSDPCLPGSYHTSAAVYYCPEQPPYASRWLPPPAADLFPYSNTFCE